MPRGIKDGQQPLEPGERCGTVPTSEPQSQPYQHFNCRLPAS